jgi:hypothetical protein
MIEFIETYSCEEQGCGRKFKTKHDLISHYKRRHDYLYLKYNKKEEKSKKLLNKLNEKIGNIEKESQIMIGYDDEMSDNLVSPEAYELICDEQNAFSPNECSINLNNKNYDDKAEENCLPKLEEDNIKQVTTITSEMIGLGSKYADWDEIEEVHI